MTNPTSNYGFVLPTATDLVTDLPADFEVALQGVDTQLKALQPGTTLGDLAYSSATANTNTRLGIGSTGQVLTVAAGVPSWAAASSYTQLATGSLTGTSVSITSLPAKDDFLIVLSAWSHTDTGSQNVNVRLNNDSGNNYYLGSAVSTGASSFTAGGAIAGAANGYFVISIAGGKTTQIKRLEGAGNSNAGQSGFWNDSTTVNRIDLYPNVSGAYSFDNGTYYIWGR